MHDSSASDNDYFKCDFCRNPWADDRPMVEGHRGSLICAHCLTVACAQVLVLKAGSHVAENITCALCLEHHDTLHWESPLFPGTFACKRCINQSGRILQKDAESGWKMPT
jgi:hypothetical protein